MSTSAEHPAFGLMSGAVRAGVVLMAKRRELASKARAWARVSPCMLCAAASNSQPALVSSSCSHFAKQANRYRQSASSNSRPADSSSKGRKPTSGWGGDGLNSGVACTLAAGSKERESARRHDFGVLFTGAKGASRKALVPKVALRLADNSIFRHPGLRIKITAMEIQRTPLTSPMGRN